ncbi:MAG: hypothetical protein R3B83_05825 [Nitrospirales bacterium]
MAEQEVWENIGVPSLDRLPEDWLCVSLPRISGMDLQALCGSRT